MNEKRYGFVTVDVFTKQASVYVGSTTSSTQSALAWERARYELKLPDSVRVLNDNGNENLGAFAQLLGEQHITQYFARPKLRKTSLMSNALLAHWSGNVCSGAALPLTNVTSKTPLIPGSGSTTVTGHTKLSVT